ncbi:hypothetical protein V1515DRAFT_592979 [Lipomyces mesembrius]
MEYSVTNLFVKCIIFSCATFLITLRPILFGVAMFFGFLNCASLVLPVGNFRWCAGFVLISYFAFAGLSDIKLFSGLL